MSRQPGRVRVVAVGFFLFVGIFLLVGCTPQPQVVSEVEEPVQRTSLCVEMILRGNPYSFIVRHKEDGMVERTGHKGGTCDRLGEKVRIQLTDFLGLFPVSWREYYPRRIREPVPTWFSMGTLNQYEPSDLKKAFDTLVAEGHVQLNMSYQYDMEAYQCDQSGKNCERETEHDDFDSRAIDFKIIQRQSLTIGGEDYEAWVIEWDYGKFIYSPLLKIPLQSFEYSVRLKDPEPHLVHEVVGIHRLKTAPASGRQ